MKNIFKYVLITFALVLFSGCGSMPISDSGLFEDLYARAKNGNYRDSSAALIMLSNMDLSIEEISKIQSVYANEQDEEKKLYYEYVLAKRTQEQIYIDSFIESAANNKKLIIKNDSRWVSIISPIYQMIAYYSKGADGDKALTVLLRLIEDADGVILGTISHDIYTIYRLNPDRLNRIVIEEKMDMVEIKSLFQEE